MNKSIKVSNLFLLLCIGIFIFNSSVVLAENDNVENNSQAISDAEKNISDYMGENASNRFKQNMSTLDNYYENINEKLQKDNNFSKNRTPDDQLKKQLRKSLLQTINVEDTEGFEKKQTTVFETDKVLYDEQLLDLMKEAGVEKDNQKDKKDDSKKTRIKVYRDPFSLTRTLTGGGRLIEDSLPFAQKTFAEKMPKMVLKGVVKKPDGTRVALLELDDKVTYMVKENDRVGLSAIGLKMVIHIQEIHENTIIIEPGEINTGQESEVIVVR